MKTRQMISFFHLLFPLYLFVTFIFAFENSQNSFWSDSPVWSILACKIPQFWTFWTFLESRRPEFTKNPYYAPSSEWSQEMVPAHGLC